MKKLFLALTLLIPASTYLFLTAAYANTDCVYTELLRMITGNNIDGIKAYAKQGCDLKPADKFSVSSLELAVILNREDALDALIAADAELVKQHGPNALVSACSHEQKNKTAIELLLKKGVDINALSTHHFSCLYNAAVVADHEFFNYLIQLGADPARKVIPDAIYGTEKQISVADFIRQRAEAFNALQKSLPAQKL